MRVLLATDAFPPRAGGSGWSTYELARGLRSRGHHVCVVQPRPGEPTGAREREYEGFRVTEIGFPAPTLPYVRNYFKNERLYAALADALTAFVERERIDIVHGQHVLTCLPSIEAAHRLGRPAVCTIRDYWPVCYWSDLIYSRDGTALCPGCSAAMMTRCIRPRGGPLWPMALPMIPYMRANLARKRTGLAAADAVIAVSSTMGADLKQRAPELDSTRVEIIPNAVDVRHLQDAAAKTARRIEGPYALYVGKLAPNKGTSKLVDVIEHATLDWPFVIAGDGPDRPAIEAAARQSRRDIRFVGWIDRQDTIAWLAHASMVVFPSRGPESLSRVLLEAGALGIPVAAMNTGGTRDIITHEETGLLSTTPEQFARDVRRLREDESLRHRLGAAARHHVERTFDTPIVLTRVETLYRELIASADRR